MSLIKEIRNRIIRGPAPIQLEQGSEIIPLSGKERDIIENQCLELIAKPDFSIPDFEQFVQNMINLLGGKETQTDQKESKVSKGLEDKMAGVIIYLGRTKTSYVEYDEITTGLTAQYRQTDSQGNKEWLVDESVLSTSHTPNFLSDPKITFEISLLVNDVPTRLQSYILGGEHIAPRDLMFSRYFGRVREVQPGTLGLLCENVFALYSKTYSS